MTRKGYQRPRCRKRQREFGNCNGRYTGKPPHKPKGKAWSLYGDVCRREILEAALWQVIANGGVPGVDGVRVEDLAEDEGHRELWLARLETDLREKTYIPQPCSDTIVY